MQGWCEAKSSVVALDSLTGVRPWSSSHSALGNNAGHLKRAHVLHFLKCWFCGCILGTHGALCPAHTKEYVMAPRKSENQNYTKVRDGKDLLDQ